MSGGGGGGGGGAGPGFAEQSSPPACEDLDFVTALSDPIPDIVEGLREGDTLRVELQTEPHRRIAALTNSGEVAGAVATQQFDRLLECLQAGNAYQAEVRSVDGGDVRVRVHPA